MNECIYSEISKKEGTFRESGKERGDKHRACEGKDRDQREKGRQRVRERKRE